MIGFIKKGVVLKLCNFLPLCRNQGHYSPSTRFHRSRYRERRAVTIFLQSGDSDWRKYFIDFTFSHGANSSVSKARYVKTTLKRYFLTNGLLSLNSHRLICPYGPSFGSASGTQGLKSGGKSLRGCEPCKPESSTNGWIFAMLRKIIKIFLFNLINIKVLYV